MTIERCEVGVLGGGPAGATAAACLARSGVSCLLFTNAAEPLRLGESLPPGSKPLLTHLGVWDAIGDDRHLQCCGNESAWGAAAVRSTPFVADPNGYGWHLDRPRFNRLLVELARHAGALVHTSAGSVALERDRSVWSVTSGLDGVRARLRWMIDCTGQRSSLARRAGARRVTLDQLVAFVASCAPRSTMAPDVDLTTLVESGPDGWWYTSRLSSSARVVAYLTDAHDPSARVASARTGFAALLAATSHVAARSARCEIGTIRVVAAGTARLDRVSGSGWTAAGDAAMSLDPLSSQGILNAMYSGMTAARAVTAHLGGDRHALREYAARLDDIFQHYLRNRLTYYGDERRWRDRPFWQRRTAA